MKNIRPITLIVWVLGRIKKMPKKGSKNEKKYFLFVLNKYQSVPHVSTSIFKDLFRSVALVTKKVMGYFRFFFTKTRLFTALLGQTTEGCSHQPV